MKKNLGLWLFGLSAYMVFSLWLTPAAWWLKLVSLPPALQLGPVQGTLFSGQISGVAYGAYYLPQLQWQLSLSSFWRGKITLKLQGGNSKESQFPFVDAKALLGWQALELTSATVRLPVATVLPQLQLPMPVDASGDLVLNIQSFVQGAPYCQALTGNAAWQQARFKAPNGWIDLQSIGAQLSCQEGHLRLVTNRNNPLSLEVQADVLADSYQIKGTLLPDPGMPKEVHQAMQFVGQKNAEGRFLLELQGQIR